ARRSAGAPLLRGIPEQPAYRPCSRSTPTPISCWRPSSLVELLPGGDGRPALLLIASSTSSCHAASRPQPCTAGASKLFPTSESSLSTISLLWIALLLPNCPVIGSAGGGGAVAPSVSSTTIGAASDPE